MRPNTTQTSTIQPIDLRDRILRKMWAISSKGSSTICFLPRTDNAKYGASDEMRIMVIVRNDNDRLHWRSFGVTAPWVMGWASDIEVCREEFADNPQLNGIVAKSIERWASWHDGLEILEDNLVEVFFAHENSRPSIVYVT